MHGRSLLSVVAVACTFACGASKDSPPPSQGDPLADSGADGDATFDAQLLDSNPPDFSLSDTLNPEAEPPTDTYVYGDSQDRLYRLDAKTLAVTEIGLFKTPDGKTVDQMTDIALDKDGVMYGVTFSDVYRIDYKTGGDPVCTHLATLTTQFNGLTFVPAGMIDAASEVLIGVAGDGGWWRIDVSPGSPSAKLTQLGSYGGGLLSSGDTVGIIGDQVYATVEGTSAPGDHLIIVDPKTGAMTKDVGDTKVPGLWGLGYWGGVLYGFKSSGELYSIDRTTAASKLIPGTTKPDNGWWGAGVRTSAPTSIK